jgi:hypothetical protein
LLGETSLGTLGDTWGYFRTILDNQQNNTSFHFTAVSFTSTHFKLHFKLYNSMDIQTQHNKQLSHLLNLSPAFTTDLNLPCMIVGALKGR